MVRMIQTLKNLYWVVRHWSLGTHLQTECGQEKLHLSILALRTGQVICLIICSLSMMTRLLRIPEECIKYILNLQRRCSRFLMRI
nr:MAG TPA: hypothetical protein [Caudoviricetes sp.]